MALAFMEQTYIPMLIAMLLKRLSLQQQFNYVRKYAVHLGVRRNENRVLHLYLLRKRIVEVLFEEDDATKKPEKLIWLPGLQDLQNHLAKEFKASSF
jgi:hypothetical protein